MRLALVTHNVRRGDGQGRVNYEIARHLTTLGAQVTLFADAVDSDLLDLGCKWCAVRPRGRTPMLLRVWEFVRRADNQLRRVSRHFDVIHANGFTFSLSHQVNTAHMIHSAWEKSPWNRDRNVSPVRSAYHKLYTRLNTRWEAVSYSRARVVVAVSQRVKAELHELKAGLRDIRVITNGVNLMEFAPGAAERMKLGLPQHVPLLLFAGDIKTGLKNLDSVLQAVKAIPECHLAVVGRIDDSPFPRRTSELEIADRVHFMGFRRDTPAIMRAVDLFVFPSRYESFSLVLLEAMASGLPVITARTVGAAELVTEESGVVLEHPNDMEGLVSSIRRLLADPELRRRMGACARRIAEQHSWERMASDYARLYEEMAVSNSRTF